MGRGLASVLSWREKVTREVSQAGNADCISGSGVGVWKERYSNQGSAFAWFA